MALGLAIGITTLEPDPPVTLSDIKSYNTIIDGKPVWVLETTRTQHSECLDRPLSRWFVGEGGRKWQQSPINVSRGAMQGFEGRSANRLGTVRNQITFEVTGPYRGVYVVYSDGVVGCDNGYEQPDRQVVIEVPFDWRDVKN